MYDLLYILTTLLLYWVVMRRDAVWGFVLIAGSINLIGTLGNWGAGGTFPSSVWLRDSCVFLILLWVWMYSKPTNPEHIRYRVRH